jgi:hypothetical protein
MGSPVNPLGIKTPTPSVFIIPPEEEQEENPPWCCYDPEDPTAEASSYVFARKPEPRAGDVEFVADLEADPNWHGEDDAPEFRRSDSRPLNETAVMPRRGNRASVYYSDREEMAAGMGSGSMDVDDEVIEVVRVGRRRTVEAEAEEQAAKGDTWKSGKGVSLRARAAQAFKSMRNGASVKGPSAKTDARTHVKDVFRSVENEQRGPGPVRRMSAAKLARKSSKSTKKTVAPLERPEHSQQQPSASFEAPRSTSGHTLTRRLSQLFVSTSRSSLESTRMSTRDARPQSPPLSGSTMSSTHSSSLVDVAMSDSNDAWQAAANHEAEPDTRPLSPGLQPKRGASIRRLSIRNLKGMFTRDVPPPTSSAVAGPSLPASRSSTSTLPSETPTSTQSPAPSHSSSSYSPYIGIGSPTLPMSPILMSHDSRTVSDSSTEPPETPNDPVSRFSFDRDRPARSSFAISRMAEDMAAGSKVDMDENLELRLDSLHFDSIHFNPDEFELSL